MALIISIEKQVQDQVAGGNYTTIKARRAELTTLAQIKEARRELCNAIEELVIAFQQSTRTVIKEIDLGDPVTAKLDIGP